MNDEWKGWDFMNNTKKVAWIALAMVPAAVVFAPTSETKAAGKSDTFAYYIGNTYYSDVITYVEALINQINPYSTSFHSQVQLAKNAYESLTTTQKNQVSNADLLFQYLNTYTDYQTVVNTFSTKMNAISIYNRTFLRDVELANRYYNSLTAIEKSFISSYLVTQLNNYITNIANMRAVEEKFDALNLYDSNYQSQYLAAMQAYHALPYNYRNLISAKADEKRKENELYYSLDYNRAAAQRVMTAISQLSTISSAEEVQGVRDLYNQLTVYQKSFITNVQDLIYIESVIKNPELGWDPDYYDWDDEDDEGISITQNGKTYSVNVPLSEMNLYTPTTITVSSNIKIKLNRTSIPNYKDVGTIAMAIDEYDGDSIIFTATVNNENVTLRDTVEIEMKGLPANAKIYKVDSSGHSVPASYTKSGTKYTIKTNSSAQFVVSNNTTVFYDIDYDENRYAIEQLALRNIVSGVSPDYFKPYATVTIGEYATMIARALNLSTTKTSTYLDVKGKWYESAIEALLDADILNVKNGQYFYPNKTVTRQEAAMISVRMLKQAGYSLPTANTNKVPFKDFNNVASNARYHVAIAYQLSIFGGKSNGNFEPNEPLTRSQMAKVLYTTLHLANKL